MEAQCPLATASVLLTQGGNGLCHFKLIISKLLSISILAQNRSLVLQILSTTQIKMTLFICFHISHSEVHIKLDFVRILYIHLLITTLVVLQAEISESTVVQLERRS